LAPDADLVVAIQAVLAANTLHGNFATVEELCQAVLASCEAYDRTWLIERHGFKLPAVTRHEPLSPADLAALASTQGPSIHVQCRSSFGDPKYHARPEPDVNPPSAKREHADGTEVI
jgi:hypothetical protein